MPAMHRGTGASAHHEVLRERGVQHESGQRSVRHERQRGRLVPAHAAAAAGSLVVQGSCRQSRRCRGGKQFALRRCGCSLLQLLRLRRLLQAHVGQCAGLRCASLRHLGKAMHTA